MANKHKNNASSPGSEEAVAAGCTCPVAANYDGEGIPINEGRLVGYWVNKQCKLHGSKDGE